jgi:hypothetical protein
MLKSGLIYDFGLGFWGPNGHDAIWHLGLITQILESFPPLHPVFSGSLLSNYHWGYNLFTAIISYLLPFSLLDIYFRILPITFALFLGIFTYTLGFKLSKNHTTALFFVFLNYFSGSFGWIISLIRYSQISGESTFWSMQPISTQLNPPFAFSLIILFSGLIYYLNSQKQKKLKNYFILGLIFSLLAGIKIYAGLLVGISISIIFLIKYFQKNKDSKYLLTTIFTQLVFSTLILIFLRSLNSGSLLEFKPFWFTHSLIESYDKLFLPQIASLRANLAQNPFSYKLPILLFIEISLFLLFIVGNLGLRVFSIFIIKKIKSQNNIEIHQFILIIILLGITIPTFFVQKGTAWNTIQFFYYSLFLINYYFAVYLSSQKTIIALFLLLLTLPTSYSTLKDYFGYPPPSAIYNSELNALKFLKSQPRGNVLTYPYNKYERNKYKTTPLPIYAYETTSYVAAFSSKPVYLEDEMNLNITGLDWQTRRINSEKFFNSTDQNFSRGFLINNNILYIYLLTDQNFPLLPSQIQIDLIYDQDGVLIYKVQR